MAQQASSQLASFQSHLDEALRAEQARGAEVGMVAGLRGWCMARCSLRWLVVLNEGHSICLSRLTWLSKLACIL